MSTKLNNTQVPSFPTKSRTVQHYLDKLGWDASPKVVISHMELDGVKDIPSKALVSIIKTQHSRLSQLQGRSATTASQIVTLEALHAAEVFIKTAGGLDNAQKIMEAISKLH